MDYKRRFHKTRVLSKVLRLLKQCKVPHFHATTNPGQLQQMQWDVSERLDRLFPMMLRCIERNHRTIFDEHWGHLTLEVRKYFVLVFFEHNGTSHSYERAEYQPNEEAISNLEDRLYSFKPEVIRILTNESNACIQHWLFHHYGTQLALTGWKSRPGETYGFVRLCHFLLDNKIITSMQLGYRMLAFGENFAKQLVGSKQGVEYQELGLTLLDSLMTVTHIAGRFTNNAEDILILVLRYIQKSESLNLVELWNVIYYAARSIPDRNPSLDDEIMRTLISLLVQDTNFKNVHLTALIRMLTLDVPEVIVRESHFQGSFLISGEECSWDEFEKYILNRLNREIDGKTLRISIRWRIKVGQLIPNLLACFIECNEQWRLAFCLKTLNLLLRVTLFPIGRCWWQMRARLRMNCSLLAEIFAAVENFCNTLNLRTSLHAQALRDVLRWEDILHYFQAQIASHKLFLQGLRNIFITIHFATAEMHAVGMDKYLRQPHNSRACQRHKDLIQDIHLRIQGILLLMERLPDVLRRYTDRLQAAIEPEPQIDVP